MVSDGGERPYRTHVRGPSQMHAVQVMLSAFEDLAHLLADADEIREAREEGIEILDARGPRQVVLEDGRVSGLRTRKVLSIFDENGRFAPKYDDSDERIHPGDMVVEAIGQATAVDRLGEALTEELEWGRERLRVDDDLRRSAD